MKNILHALCKYYLLMLGDRNDANCKRYFKYSTLVQYSIATEKYIWKIILYMEK